MPESRWRSRHSEGGGKQHEPFTERQCLAETESIESFHGKNKFLSNFFWSRVKLDGLEYPSVEHAFQAAKLKSNEERIAQGFLNSKLSFGEAKRLGRQVLLRDDWKDIREDIMKTCLISKFADASLRTQLLATGQKQLIDGHWGSPDTVWGYHYPSQAGENRLGKLLMELRSELRAENRSNVSVGKEFAALYHLDWPMKCLQDGLPEKYSGRLLDLSRACDLASLVCVLPTRMICIALLGSMHSIDSWEHRMRTENVDVNSRGKPCRERMLVQLRQECCNSLVDHTCHTRTDAASWSDLMCQLGTFLMWPREVVHAALGPERPLLPTRVVYTPNRAGVILNGKEYPLCLNESHATFVVDLLLGCVDGQQSKGGGEIVPLASGEKPTIFGGRFARQLVGALSHEECGALIRLSESLGYGLAGSRGFNPFARFALRCLVDAPNVAAVLDKRLGEILPQQYPPHSGQQRVGFNHRLRFLKYLPGMHHAGDHTDCPHEDPETGKSAITVQMYLNTEFTGGRTTFISDRLIPVEPTVGGIIAFDHELYHRGGVVTSGTKYALRMDVMYKLPLGRETQTMWKPSRGDTVQSAANAQDPGNSKLANQGSRRWTKRRDG